MLDFTAKYLSSVISVPFRLITPKGITLIGSGAPQFTIRINHKLNKRRMMTDTSLALGEAYMSGDIETDKDLYFVLNKILMNIKSFKCRRNRLRKILKPSESNKAQKKQVCSHYDIGNEFYSLWLDKTMSYSCGYFSNKNDTLYDAQVQKTHHILEKLNLSEDMTLLDIGCGWGFLLIEAAKLYNIRGMGITLSKNQYEKFARLIKDEGLSDRLTVRLMDYRELKGSGLSFDRVVSVGMLEHVGRENYSCFMENVNAVLNPGGIMLLHYISSLKESSGNPWIKKYIFPGGTIPSLREIIDLLPEYNFHTIDIENLRQHYKLTLLHWRTGFNKHKKQIVDKMGIKFARMWDLYLAGCAAAFNNGIVDLHQILISKGVNNKIPINRVV